MKIAVLFDGAGLARLGLEQAGHVCVGVELDPHKHHLSSFVGHGSCVLADAREFDLTGFDAVWASPPCQLRSQARTQGAPRSAYADDLVDWALALDIPVLWVENVVVSGEQFGALYNAAQFHKPPHSDQESRNWWPLPSPRGVSPIYSSTQRSLSRGHSYRVSRMRKRPEAGVPILWTSANSRGMRLPPRFLNTAGMGNSATLVQRYRYRLEKPAVRGHWKWRPGLYGTRFRGSL